MADKDLVTRPPDIFQQAVEAVGGAEGLARAMAGAIGMEERDKASLALKTVRQWTRGGMASAVLMLARDLQSRVELNEESSVAFAATLEQALEAIDKDEVDDVKFEAIRNILVNGVRAYSASGGRDVLVYQMMKTCRALNSGEVLVLRGAYQAAKKQLFAANRQRDWVEVIAQESGLVFRELVQTHQQTLFDKNLLVRTGLSDAEIAGRGGLTQFGYAFCSFMTNSEKPGFPVVPK